MLILLHHGQDLSNQENIFADTLVQNNFRKILCPDTTWVAAGHARGRFAIIWANLWHDSVPTLV